MNLALNGESPQLTVPFLFGNGLLGHAMTGLVRIPAILASATAASMFGELTIRAIGETVAITGWEAKKDGWIDTVAKQVDGLGIRPHRKTSAGKLAGQTVCLVALSIFATELVRVLGGPPPSIYNNVLAFMGPIRIYNGSYLEGVYDAIQSFRSFRR